MTSGMPATVLIVDDELGFLLWLATVLGEAGHRAVPAKTVTGAERMARAFPPNVLVVNPELRGAAHLIDTQRTRNVDLKVIALADPTDQLEDVIVIPRPTEITAETGKRWLRTIENILGLGNRPKVRHGGGT